MLLADFEAYLEAQAEVDECFADRQKWLTKAALNIVGAAKFSSDRTIREYAADIWDVKPVPEE